MAKQQNNLVVAHKQQRLAEKLALGQSLNVAQKALFSNGFRLWISGNEPQWFMPDRVTISTDSNGIVTSVEVG